MTKAPTPTEIKKTKRQHKNVTKHFDNTTVVDRFRTVSWGNDGHPTSAIKLVYGIPTLPLTAKAV